MERAAGDVHAEGRGADLEVLACVRRLVDAEAAGEQHRVRTRNARRCDQGPAGAEAERPADDAEHAQV